MPCLKSPNVKNETSSTNEKHVASRKNILSIYLCNHLFGYDVYALLLMRGCLCKRRRNYPRVYNYCIKKYLPNVWTNMIEWNQLCRVGGVLYVIFFYASDVYGSTKSVFIRFTIPKSMNWYPWTIPNAFIFAA